MKRIQIKNFDLHYNGMYFILWKGCRIRVYLGLNTILRMIEVERLIFEEINQKINHSKPVRFNEVVMEVMIESNVKRTLQTIDMACDYSNQNGFNLFDIGYKTMDGFV